jgi:hypothetical protein
MQSWFASGHPRKSKICGQRDGYDLNSPELILTRPPCVQLVAVVKRLEMLANFFPGPPGEKGVDS